MCKVPTCSNPTVALASGHESDYCLKHTAECKWCRAHIYTGHECTGCWELRSRVEANPVAALRFLANHLEEK